TDAGPGEKLVERGDRSRMNEQLADVGGHLNEENPAVVAPQPSSDRLQERDVERRSAIILVERLVPTVVDPHPVPAQDRAEELHPQDMGADPPEIEIAVASRLDAEKNRDQQPHENERQWRSSFAAEGQRQRQSGGDDRPIRCRIEPRTPNGAAIELPA